MKKNNSNSLLYILLVVFFVLFALMFTLIKQSGYKIEITKTPKGNNLTCFLPEGCDGDKKIITENKTCGVQGCHGLDITCGKDIPEMCDLMYQVGDNCRQLATCEIDKNGCGFVETPEFKSCKSCVQSCLTKYKNNSDPTKLDVCEQSCTPSTDYETLETNDGSQSEPGFVGL